MATPIIQSARFNATPKRLYSLYVDPALHSKVTGGGKVVISPEPGSLFSAFDGELKGVTLHAAPGKLIVQRWRSASWPKADPDSILTLVFRKDGAGGVIDLCHVNVPGHDRSGVRRGWRDYYWTPMRAWLASSSGTKR